MILPFAAAPCALAWILDVRMPPISRPSGKASRSKKNRVYVKRQCWISGDPDEKALAHIIECVGNDKFFWATHFLRFTHPGNYLEALNNLVSTLPDGARKNLLGDSAAKVYGLN